MNNTFGIDLIPQNEAGRIHKLHDYRILEGEVEGTFNRIASLTAHIFKVPIALVSFVDSAKVWYKGNVGMEEVQHLDRGISLCSLSILREEATIFKDTFQEPCLLANPLVAGEFGLRFYAAAPLRTHDGFNIGSVCVVDRTPREFTQEDQVTLEYMAKLVMDELELLKCKLYLENLN